MRQMAAAALAALYEPNNISPLSLFTDRFKARFAELIYDVDELVAVQGVCLDLIPPSLPTFPPSSLSIFLPLFSTRKHAHTHARTLTHTALL